MNQTARALNFEAALVLLARDVRRFFRQKSRIAGALVQPLIFWGVFSSGLARAFQVPGAQGISYAEYFYPGVVVMIVLFAAMISIALAITNLLPIPGLDGGRILLVVVELIRGKPMAPEREGLIHFIGLLFLLALIAFALINDIANPIDVTKLR